MTSITVRHESGDRYAVDVGEPGDTSRHVVTATAAHLGSLGLTAAPEAVIEESFRFLLEREPKESILTQFELPVIGRYFPEYPAEIRRRMAQ
jgi:hypothetical protein